MTGIKVATTQPSKEATRIVIAHRLSKLVAAVRIYVVNEGRVVDEGRYEDRIKRGGLLSALARRQSVRCERIACLNAITFGTEKGRQPTG